MDKKTEIALQKRRSARLAETTPPPSPAPSPDVVGSPAGAPAPAGSAPSGWWMYHGDPAHTGYVSDSDITSTSLGSFETLATLQLGGPVLSVPAITDGFVYVGIANSQSADGGNGGALHKIDIATGTIVATFSWNLGCDSRDTHSFAGMGMTPAIVGGRVYFGAYNGKLYCLDASTLAQIWVTNLRVADPAHNQPITNVDGVAEGSPAAVMWSSPVFTSDGTRLFVGCGEGENPALYSFVFCLDASTGDVVWIFCTNKFSAAADNAPNALPAAAVLSPPPPAPFTLVSVPPIVMGCSVWGSIAYDETLDRIYCPTGNQQPEPNDDFPTTPFTPELPGLGYSNGLLSLDASTGAFRSFFQVTLESCYRETDVDVDVGSSPVLFDSGGTRVVCFPCKNGSVFVLDADTLALLRWRQLLPFHRDGSQIETVDRHPAVDQLSDFAPHVSNDVSNANPGENYSGAFNTPAFYPGSTDDPQTISPRLFVALGGPNYHPPSPGIDFETTPFMRAIDAESLEDVWPLDDNDPPRYAKAMPPMYTTAGESGLSSPAVVNDVVFCTTSKIAIYAFDVRDGTKLWEDDLGMQTDGYNGGYGFCLGAAIWKNYVVAGALVFGRADGGLLRIYTLPAAQV